METLISVIVPVYNTAPYLDRCISSIAANSYQNLEIICVNDGSKDNSLEVLQALAEKDSRITVIDKPNGGVSTARNQGMEAAHGEWICFVDSDDWIHQDFFKTLIAAADGADLVVGNYENANQYDEAGRIAPLPTNPDVQILNAEAAVADGYVRCSPVGRLFRRSLIGEMIFTPGLQYAEDAVFNVALFSEKADAKIVRIHVPLYFYFNRPGSLVHTFPVDMLRLGTEAFLAHAEMLHRKDLCLYQAFRMALLYRYYGLLTNDKKNVRRNARQLLRKCKQQIMPEKRLTLKTKVSLLAAASSATLYRLSLIMTDKSYLQVEKRFKEQNHQG